MSVKHHSQNELVNRFLRAKKVALEIAQRKGVEHERCNRTTNKTQRGHE